MAAAAEDAAAEAAAAEAVVVVVAGRMEGVGVGRHPPQGEEGVAVLRGP